MRLPSRLAVLSFGFLFLVRPAPAQPAAPATGIVEGRVFNAATGSALANARVTLEGTGREVITDAGGEYRLTGVPSGPVRIAVTYVGMAAQQATVQVPAGGAVQREFELVLERAGRPSAAAETVKLDAFTVVEDREMSAQAVSMNERRTAPNLKSVVAIDEFGDRGNENIGEFLLFLPGASISTSGSEPTSISLRGFPGSNTGITIDGAEIAATQSGASRALDLREVPFNNVSRIEITKVPTPDMPASGLGGSVNMITRSGFETKRPRFSFNAYTMFHNRSGLTFDAGPRTAHSSTTPRFIEPSFDFNYRQSLTFLPQWARGFQVFANATKLNLSGSRTADFSGYNPKSLSGGLSLVRARFALKGTISVLGDINTGAVAASATVPAGTFNYQGKRTRIGLNATYSLTRRYSLYASLVDLGGFVQNNQRYAPSTPDYAKGTRWQELGFYTNVGVRGSF